MRTETVWIQNLKGFIKGIFPANDEWKKIFIERLDAIDDAQARINASDVPGLMDLVSSAASASATVRVRIEGDGEPIEYERRPAITEIPGDAEYVGESVDNDANVYGAYKDANGTIYITRMWAGDPAGTPLFLITARGLVIDRPS